MAGVRLALGVVPLKGHRGEYIRHMSEVIRWSAPRSWVTFSRNCNIGFPENFRRGSRAMIPQRPRPSPRPFHRQPSRPRPSPDPRFQQRPVTRRTRRDTLRHPMTVCIAALAKTARAIVAVSDTMVGCDEYTNDLVALKMRPLPNGWIVMYCGIPTTFALMVSDLADWLEGNDRPTDYLSMMQAARHAYAGEVDRQAARILLPLNFTRDEFKRNGLKQLGPRVHPQIANEIHNIKVDTSLMLAGMDPSAVVSEPHLISMENGACSLHDDVGFYAIGSGYWRALASLQANKTFVHSKRLGEVCFRMQEAKFAAEDSPFVGPSETITQVLHFDGRLSLNFGAAPSRKYFEAESVRPLPDDLLDAVETSLAGFFTWTDTP